MSDYLANMQDVTPKKTKVYRERDLTCEALERREEWTTNYVFLAAFFFRVLLVFYGRIHDYFFKVSFTDIDYGVFSDAAAHVYNGESPFVRSTYRYSPMLAWLLIPTVFWPDFGKFLFCVLDIVVGWLCYRTALNFTVSPVDGLEIGRIRYLVLVFWLINPLTAVISARGNADVLVCATVLYALYLVMKRNLISSALFYGLSVHLKIYPVIYLPSVFLSLSRAHHTDSFIAYLKNLFCNLKGFIFLMISLFTIASTSYLCYLAYGFHYLDEAVIYHLKRTDSRHNFSPYFYILYLCSGDVGLSRLVGIGAFLPQAALIIYFAFRYYEDLPFCWLLSTFSFVTFNKVCTSQYFVWYICLLPAACMSLRMSLKRAMVLVLLWFFGQLLWLLPAYLFEFQGYNSFFYMWLASLAFLLINSGIIVQLCSYHFERITSCEEAVEKKVQ